MSRIKISEVELGHETRRVKNTQQVKIARNLRHPLVCITGDISRACYGYPLKFGNNDSLL